MNRRKRILDDLDQDIRDHIAQETQDNIDRGMSSEEARYAALRKFGNVTRVQEETREVWSLVWLAHLLQDVRYGLRMLRKSPGFTSIAVLTLALGIGANTAIFSLIDAVMLRSLPVANPSQLVLLKWTARKAPNTHGFQSAGDCPMEDLRPGAANPSGCSFSEPMFREIAQANVFSGTAAFANTGRLNLTGNGAATVINGQLVSGDFFRTMGLQAAIGRLLDANDDTPSAAPVAVLNYGYWQSAFGGSRDVVGRTIELNNVSFTIVGVAEQRFTGITPGSDYDVWLPLSDGRRISSSGPFRWSDRDSDTAFWWLTILGRLKPETPLAQAQAVVTGIFRNEMLHGPVPLFHDGGGIPGGPGPAPGAGGNTMIRREVTVGGPPPSPGGPTRASIPAPAQLSPGMRPLKGPVGDPANVRKQAPGGPPPQSVGNQPFMTTLPPGAAPPGATPAGGPPPADAAGEPQTLSTAADNPQAMLLPAQSGLIGERTRYSDPLYVLMLAVGIILVIACANVAGLMLARAAARQK
jgi:hypothetical protein